MLSSINAPLFTAASELAAVIMKRVSPRYRIRGLLRQEDITEAWADTEIHPTDFHSLNAKEWPAGWLQVRWWQWRRVFISQEQIRRESRSAVKAFTFGSMYGSDAADIAALFRKEQQP